MKHRFAILALTATIGLGAVSTAMADGLPYRITDTLVGSMIPQDIIRAAVPFDGRYEELNAEQKAALARDYQDLPAGDEPPFPMYGLRHMVRPLVRFADTWEPVGPLVASVMVDAQGNTGDVTIYHSPDQQLTQLVVGVLSHEKYKPAVCSGEPCAMAYMLRLDFPRRGIAPVMASAMTRYAPNQQAINMP
jgi:hypothetical protein